MNSGDVPLSANHDGSPCLRLCAPNLVTTLAVVVAAFLFQNPGGNWGWTNIVLHDH